MRIIPYNYSSVKLLGYSLKACFSLLWVDSAYVIKSSMDGSEKLKISYGVGDTQFGLCLVAWVGEGICFLAFGNKDGDIDYAISDMKKLWNRSEFAEDFNGADKLITSIFDKNHKPDLIVIGTDFQIKVWNELMNIPFGTTVSYEAAAIQVGGRNYTRPVASAISRNNISYLIPCHRVINKSGHINKYRWGTNVKSKLLEWEGATYNQKLEKNRLY